MLKLAKNSSHTKNGIKNFRATTSMITGSYTICEKKIKKVVSQASEKMAICL